MVQKILGKSDIPNKKKGKKKKGTRVAVGFSESIKTKTKQNKTNVTPDKDDMTSANQTPGGYRFAPLVAIK